MATPARIESGDGWGRSVLDLAPLERECMRVLWPRGEGTVRQIRDALAPTHARAYTTIMTIMDRLARKGVVARHKVGRAYLYRPNFSEEEACARAVEQLLGQFFGGSTEALLAHLRGERVPARPPASPPIIVPARPRRARRTAPVERLAGAPAKPIDESLL